MSSSGWGGPGNQPQGEPWQNGTPQGGTPQNGSPQNGVPQGGQPQPGSAPQGGQFGAPSPAPWQSPPSAPHPGFPQGPGGPPQGPGYGPPQGPGGPPQTPRSKRPWVIAGVALTCVFAMLLVVGGGITFLVLNQGGEEATAGPESPTTTAEDPESSTPTESATSETTTPEAAEESPFEVVAPYDPPTGSADELWEVMETNPFTEGTLPALPSCDLPDTPVEPSVEELEAVLNASATCLNQIWSTASSDRGLPWVSPKIVVYHHPDVPADATCDNGFAADFPRMCNLDSTIYWPDGYGTAREFSDPANVPGGYLWDLSFIYTNTMTWNSSLTVYYQTMRDQLETTDEERFDEAWRRFALQRQCIASATSMQVPSGAEPTPALRDALTDTRSWTEGEPPHTISPEARVRWISAGFDSGGDLSACNTWAADVEDVT
ncbi:hypothetical protein [Brachybacterium sp.]|uniref:hypothetical protein n=1 Tax=Brachybacterium sp. TaxID=1891286 RepID=UPI002ED5510F